MTKLEALKELAAFVEGRAEEANMLTAFPRLEHRDNVAKAHSGSLDAAKALHEAVLPGWVVYRAQWWPTARDPAIYELWQTRENREGAWCHSHPDLRVEAFGDDPARAWLLAILRALIAKEEAA